MDLYEQPGGDGMSGVSRGDHRFEPNDGAPSPARRLRSGPSLRSVRGAETIGELALAATLAGGLGGCGGTPLGDRSMTVHTIRIQQEVSPRILYVRKGDEVRWQNLQPNPVQIGILGTKWQDHLTCEKGFSQFGQVTDLVTIQPQEQVSLCFSRAGTVQYNVWLDPKNLTGSMSSTATVRVD
jgi:hypothetical protein